MRVSPLKLMLAALLALFIVPAGLAVGAEREVITYKLENGLDVVLQPDSRVPKVTVTVRYRVGSMSEPDGRSGFAHLFEHLMIFAGTPSYPYLPTTFGALGIDFNGFTYEDGTVYYQSGLSSTLPVMLSAQADQMANIGSSVDQTDLDLQRSIVLNEMRQNVLDSPGAAAMTALQTSMFGPQHPYRRAVIGSIPDVQAATLDEVRAFFDAYYVPNNAVLVVVGDIDVEATKAMIADTFGRIPRGADVVVPSVAETTSAKVRLQMVDVLATPLVFMAFTGPNALSDQNAALQFVSYLLTNESSVLRRRLVLSGIASDAGAFWQSGLLGGRFIVYAAAGAKTSAAQLETELRDAITEFLDTPIDVGDFERARDNFLLSDRTALEAIYTRADYIARIMAFEGDVTGILGDNADVLAATPEAVAAAARRVLALDQANVAVVTPGARGDYPPVLKEASGTPTPLAVAAREPVAIPILGPGTPERAALPQRETATLANGIKVIHYQMDGAPLQYLTATVTGGYNNDPPGKEGLYNMAFSVGGRGTVDLDLPALGRAANEIGASLNTWHGSMISGASLAVPAEDFAAGVALLADLIETPRFDPTEWDIVKAGLREYLVQREFDVTGVAARTLNREVFFPAPDDSGMLMTLASVDAITLDEAKAVYESTFTPKTMTIYSGGSLPLDDVLGTLEAEFGAWADSDPGVTARDPLPAIFPDKQRVVLVPVPGAAQASIYIARSAPGRAEAGFAEAVAVARLLAGDFQSRLNGVIREEKGYSYGVGGSTWETYFTGNAMTVTVPVQVDAAGAALAEVFKGFESLRTDPVTEAEINRTMTAYYTTLAGLPETAGGFFGALVGWEASGIDLDTTLRFFEGMTTLDLDKVRAEAAELASLDRAVIIIAGDADAIRPQLEAMGITDIKVVDRQQ